MAKRKHFNPNIERRRIHAMRKVYLVRTHQRGATFDTYMELCSQCLYKRQAKARKMAWNRSSKYRKSKHGPYNGLRFYNGTHLPPEWYSNSRLTDISYKCQDCGFTLKGKQ